VEFRPDWEGKEVRLGSELYGEYIVVENKEALIHFCLLQFAAESVVFAVYIDNVERRMRKQDILLPAPLAPTSKSWPYGPHELHD
jgi:hypothetical protein